MKRQLILIMLIHNIGFTQKINTIEIQLGGVKSIPLTDFHNNSNNEIV